MGELFKEGTSRPTRQDELAMYGQLRELQAQQQVPVLQRSSNPHEYLFFALFDGTGQDVDDPKQLSTNVGVLKKHLDALKDDPKNRIGGHYAEGIGTQRNPIARYLDAAFPFTWDDKIEQAYRQLADQTKQWREQDPDAQVRIASVGYSRGAVLVPGFARLVDRYGIADPKGLSFGRDAVGNLTVVSPSPPLVAPGQAAQAVGLFDPVGTNLPAHYDARLPPSVISGFSMLAADERREIFPHQTIVAPGMTPDQRFANALVPGGHSNVGGGNREPGLETLAYNGMVDYLNGLRDPPPFDYRPLPGNAALYTVYQARGVTALPGLDRDGVRNLREELANCKVVDPCRTGEFIDQALAQRFEYRPLRPSAPTPMLTGLPMQAAADARPALAAEISRQPLPPSDTSHPDHAMLEQIRRGVRMIDRNAGKEYDEVSERLSRSLLAASKDNGERYPGREISWSANALERVDHVLLGKDGKTLFAVDGGLQDPAQKRAVVDVEQAIRIPVDQSDRKLEAANRQIAQELQLSRQQEVQRQQVIGSEDPALSGPVMR